MRTVFVCLLVGSVTLPAPTRAQQSLAIIDAPVTVVNPTQRLDHLLDWNGDGVQDFAVLNQNYSTIGFTAYRNNGQGGLVGLYSLGRGGPSGETRSYMQTCDANGDLRDDLVWVEPGVSAYPSFGGFMHVFSMPGNQIVRLSHLEHDGIAAGLIHFGTVLDADLDGDADRVRISGRTLTLDLFEQGGSGAWKQTPSTLTLAFDPETLIRMDFDGDAHPDLYLHHGTQGSFVSLAGGSLQAPVTFYHGIASAMPMAIPGDVDGDGDQDLALFDMDGYALYRRTGAASWELEARREGGPAAKFADVDGDGDLDGVCCGGSGDPARSFSGPATFRVALNGGSGDFAPAFSIPGLGAREIAGAADLDGDGDVDLAGGQCIYFARGPLTGPPQRALARAQSTGSLADFDQDGDADFTPGIAPFGRHLGNGVAHDFSLLRPPPPAGTTDEGPGLPGDWDGDGDADLIVRRKLGTTFQEMRLLLNEGGGSYTDGGTAGTADFLSGVADVAAESSFAVDLDLDGDLDLATFRRAVLNTESWTKTWRNDGAGRFTFVWQRTAAWPLGFAALHGSSAPDALLVRFAGGVYDEDAIVYLHPGLGDGSFDGASVLGLYLGGDLGPASLAFEDFDLDGDLDLAGAFQFGGVSWTSGKAWFIPSVDGSLSLNDKVSLDDLEGQYTSNPPRPTPRIAIAGDVDGDGLKDVILSSPAGRRAAISIVRRASDNSGWRSPVHQVVYSFDPANAENVAAIPGACIDVDGDGDGDYVTDVIWNNVLREPEAWGSRRQDTSGSADADGRVPTLGVTGPFRPGQRMVLRLTGVPSGAAAVLSLDGELPGSKVRSLTERFLPLQAFVTQGPVTSGAGYWTRAFDIPLSFAGLEHRLRVELLDPADPTRVLRSNVLTLSFGH